MAQVILATIREHLRLTVGLEEARSPSGEVWAAQDEDDYRAAVLLAELVGMELED